MQSEENKGSAIKVTESAVKNPLKATKDTDKLSVRLAMQQEKTKLSKMRSVLADKIPQENIKIAEEKLRRFKAFKIELDESMAGILHQL